MSLQLSVTARNGRLDSIETTVGTSANLYLRTGAAPADCATGDSGSLLATIALPSDWLAAASSGLKAKSGTWSATASGSGVVGHFRIKDSGGTTCHLQGTVTLPGSGGDMTLDNTNIAINQTVTVSTFSLTDGNA